MQVVLRKSSDKDAIEKVVNDKIVEFANRGYRSLGIAKADGDSVRALPLLLLAPYACLHSWWKLLRPNLPARQVACRVTDPAASPVLC